MVFEEGNAVHMFVVPRGQTLCILVSNTERKQKCFTGNLCRASVGKQLGRPLKHLFIPSFVREPSTKPSQSNHQLVIYKQIPPS